MCIAMLARPGAVVGNKNLFQGWGGNKDGGGVAYVDKRGHLIVDKGHMTFNEFEGAYTKATKKRADDSPMLIHMRYRSAGTTNKANTHPFEFKPQKGPRGCFIHNGTLFQPSGAWRGDEKDLKSDTRVVAAALNNILTAENVLNSVKEFGDAVRSYNKLAFLYEDKSWCIINEHAGYWADGVWFSNGACGVERPRN